MQPRTPAFWPTYTEYGPVRYSRLPACDLRTLALVYITPETFLHSVTLTDIILSRRE